MVRHTHTFRFEIFWERRRQVGLSSFRCPREHFLGVRLEQHPPNNNPDQGEEIPFFFPGTNCIVGPFPLSTKMQRFGVRGIVSLEARLQQLLKKNKNSIKEIFFKSYSGTNRIEELFPVFRERLLLLQSLSIQAPRVLRESQSRGRFHHKRRTPAFASERQVPETFSRGSFSSPVFSFMKSARSELAEGSVRPWSHCVNTSLV